MQKMHIAYYGFEIEVVTRRDKLKLQSIDGKLVQLNLPPSPQPPSSCLQQ